MDYKKRQEIIAGSPISFDYLKRFNAAAGILHLIQGIVMLTLGFVLTWTRDIYTFYIKLGTASGSPPKFPALPNPQILFTVSNLGVILASFPLISAIAHFAIGIPRTRVTMRT